MSGIIVFRCSFFFFSSRRRHTRLVSDWSSDVCSSDLEFNDLLLWDQDITKELLLGERANAFLQSSFRLSLVPRVGVDDVPLLGHGKDTTSKNQLPRRIWKSHDKLASTTKRKRAVTPTRRTTVRVAARISFCVGHCTLRSSAHASCRNVRAVSNPSLIPCSNAAMTPLPWRDHSLLLGEERVRQDSNLQPPDLESGALTNSSY